MSEIRKEIKTLKKKIVSVLIIAFILAMIVPVSLILPGLKIGMAANVSNVACNVSAVSVSLSVVDGYVAYGTVALGGSKNTVTTGNDQYANNTGTVVEDFWIKTSNATGAATDWTVGTTAAANVYNHFYSIDGGNVYANGMTTVDTYVYLKYNVATSANQRFDLQIGMPTSTNAPELHNITVTVTASDSS